MSNHNIPEAGSWWNLKPVKAVHKEGKPATWLGVGRSKHKGTPYFRVALEITDEGEFQGRRYYWEGYWIGGAIKNTSKGLNAIGVDTNDIEAPFRSNFQGCIPCRGVIAHEESDDGLKTYAKVAFLVDASGGGGYAMAEVMDDDEICGFAAAMKADMAGLGLTSTPAARPNQVEPQQQGSYGYNTDDDLPF